MKRGIVFLLLLVASVSVWGQTGIVKFDFGPDFHNEGKKLLLTDDGGGVVIGAAYNRYNDPYLTYGTRFITAFKFDRNGNLEWQKPYGCSQSDFVYDALVNSNGNYVFIASVKQANGDVSSHYGTSTNSDIWIVEIDTLGNIVWEKTFGGSAGDIGYQIEQTPDGGYVFSGTSSSVDNDLLVSHNTHSTSPDGEMWLVKIDGQGNILWDKCFIATAYYNGGNGSEYDGGSLGKAMVITNDGSYVIGSEIILDVGAVGPFNTIQAFNQHRDVFVAKLDASRNVVWESYFGGTDDDFVNSIIETDDGGFLMVGSTLSSDFDGTGNRGAPDLWVVKLDSLGIKQWTKVYGSNSNEAGYNAAQMENGNYLIAGWLSGIGGDVLNNFEYSISGTHLSNDLWMLQLDEFGSIVAQDYLGSSENEQMVGIEYVSSKEVYILGVSDRGNDFTFTGLPVSGSWELVLIPIDLDTSGNRASGKIFDDENSDCVYQSATDYSWNGAYIWQSAPANRYFTPNTQGNYTVVGLDTGFLTWELIIPDMFEPFVLNNCLPTRHSLYLDSLGLDTTGFNFGLELAQCPLLTVSVDVDRRRPCVKGITKVRACNRGLADTNNVEVVVDFPAHVAVLSANYPYTVDNLGRLSFNLGTLARGACKTISITDSVICDAGLWGINSCTQAWISPGNDCYNNLANPNAPAWDGADIELSVACDATDSLSYFVIRNLGASMSFQSAYRLYTSTGILYTGSFQLSAGDTMQVLVSNTTAYLRLEADNTPSHPYMPTVFIETANCMFGAQQSSSYANAFPSFDDNLATDVSCAVITNSFDPNDKQVTPSGITTDNYVLPNTLFEYKVRFQNTGTDTAYRVEIIDTLSPYYDLASLQLGVSSHPYEFYVDGTNVPVLHWVYDNINLVDSNTNEPLSHGYFKFKIAPKQGTPELTRIENFADIYFDYNPPVRTNTPFVTLKNEYPQATDNVVVIVDGDTLYNTNAAPAVEVSFNIYPNPNNGQQFVVELSTSSQHNNLQLEIYGIRGERLGSYALKPTQTLIEPNLQNGYYLYRIVSDGQLLKTGKLLVVE